MSRAFWKRWLAFGLKAGVTVLLILMLLRGVDAEEVGRRLADLSAHLLPTVFLLLGLQVLVATWRWIFVMRLFGDQLPFATSLRLVLEGMFFNQTLPSTIGGDGVRMYRAVRRGVPATGAVNGVILDRVAGFLAMLLMFALAQPLLLMRVQDAPARAAFAGVLGVGVLGFAVLLYAARLPAWTQRWRPVVWATKLSRAARTAFLTRAVGVPVIGLSLVVQLLTVLVVFVIARDLGLPIAFLDCIAFVPATMLLAALPVSIAGWGVREGVMVAAFGLIGVAQSGSLALSILFGLAILAIGLPGGILWLLNGDQRAPDAGALAVLANSGAQPSR